MVDAIKSLFGAKSSKKIPPSSPSAFDTSITATGMDDDFTIIGHQQPKPSQQQLGGVGFNGYPVLPPLDPTAAFVSPSQPYPSGTLSSQNSVTAPHVLDGVPFVLSSRCSIGGGGKGGRFGQTDTLLADVAVRLETVQQLIQSSAYDFRLEKGVVESDISATMRRMQTY